MGQYTVHNDLDAFCLFPDLIPHFCFLKWALLNFPAVLFPLPHPQSEAFVDSLIVGYQSDRAWFMYQYHPSCLQISPLTALLAFSIQAYSVCIWLYCYCGPTAWIALSRPIGVPCSHGDCNLTFLNMCPYTQVSVFRHFANICDWAHEAMQLSSIC